MGGAGPRADPVGSRSGFATSNGATRPTVRLVPTCALTKATEHGKLLTFCTHARALAARAAPRGLGGGAPVQGQRAGGWGLLKGKGHGDGGQATRRRCCEGGRGPCRAAALARASDVKKVQPDGKGGGRGGNVTSFWCAR